MTVPPPATTVLVVEPDRGRRGVFTAALREAGYIAREAGSGTEATAQISAGTVDLVLLDINLPDLPSAEVCRSIKSTRATSAVPVIYIAATAVAAPERAAALNEGADGYLVEPVDPDELVATVAAALRHYEGRRTAERLAARFERLHQATLLMGAAPTLTDLLQFACTGLASVFGVAAAVLVSRDSVGHIATAGPSELEATIASGPAADVDALAEASLAGAVADPASYSPHLARLRGPALGSAIATPHGELVGAVLLMTDARPPEDELMLDHFAQSLAVALENQRLYAVEHKIALTLQRAMLPKRVPRPAYLEIAVRYLAASDTAEIGGDFYEAVERGQDVTLLAVGDVVGHSLQAATVMAELRHSLRAFAAVQLPADEIVARLAMLLRDSHPGVTATLCIAEVDRGGELRVTNAGHIPPLLVEPTGAARFVAEHGALLGLVGAPPPPTVRVPFPPGALVVLTTDGLIERRDEDLQVGLDRLRAIAGGAHDRADLEAVCDVLLSELAGGERTVDDIAIVAARRTTD
jgi:CheY-like chemotaxis protein